MPKQKLYAYVDESGQDSKGLIFIFGVVVLEEEYEAICQRLDETERRSGKGASKWHKSRREFRRAYIELLLAIPNVHRVAFVEIYHDTKQYLELTALTTAKDSQESPPALQSHRFCGRSIRFRHQRI